MSTQKKIAFHTLGCKLNFSETSSIANQAIDNGYCRVDFSELADIYVVNTCSVTENADKECRYITRKIKRQAPESKVVIIGCYAQLKPTEISEIEGVDMVLGANEKFNVITHLEALPSQENTVVKAQSIKDINEFVPTFSQNDRTRIFLKVQDGCDYFCTFCTIPLARGRSRSQSIAEISKVIDEAVNTGVGEIVLTGVNTGDFGKTPDGKKRTKETFYDLMKYIDENYHDIRVRVSSIEPNLLTDEVIDLVADSKIMMPHFHIPLQSGSDAMLESMQRKYDADFYRKKIHYIKSKIPHACIGVDVIVGYPEETEEHFEESYEFVKSLPVSYLHTFTYSERANTRAVKFTNSVPMNIRKERNKRFRILSEKLKRAFYEEHLGSEREVLFEKENDSGYLYGYTDNYVRVRVPYDTSLEENTAIVSLDSINAFNEVEGELVVS